MFMHPVRPTRASLQLLAFIVLILAMLTQAVPQAQAAHLSQTSTEAALDAQLSVDDDFGMDQGAPIWNGEFDNVLATDDLSDDPAWSIAATEDAQRQAQELIQSGEELIQFLTPLRWPQPEDGARTTIYLPQVTGPRIRAATNSAQGLAGSFTSSAGINLAVDESGLVCVRYEDLLAQGIDLSGIATSQLSLMNQGNAVPFLLEGPPIVGPGTLLSFYGEALDTLYTGTNPYKLLIDGSAAVVMDESAQAVNRADPVTTVAPATRSLQRNNAYMSYPPTGDPWYDTLLNVTTAPLTQELTLSLDQIAGSGDAQIELTVFGYNSVLHHLVTEFNGQLIDDGQFNGRVPYSVQQAIDLSLLQEGENTLRLTLPADTGASADYVAFEGVSVTYPRALVAVDDQLRFTAAGTHFRVDGLTSSDITVLRLDAGGPVHLNNLVVTPEGSTYSVAFAGTGAEATYLVTGAVGCRAPRAMYAVSAVADPVSGQADYVVISHPNFIDSLAPFVAAREAQGYAMRVVNVDDIYATHGNGVFGAEAIQAFVGRAIVEMGADYFLLVGADTYDYRNYLNKNYVSYIPTLYRNTTGVITFAPADPVYTDVNGDDQPDAALGRWPVRTQAEVANLIAKTLAFDNKSYEQQALLVHEDGFGVTQEAITAPLATAGWNFVMNAGPETGDPAVTKAGLVDALNAGVALTHFYGHGTNTRWTSSADLLSSTDVAALANQGKPTTLFVFDSYRTNYNTTSWYSSMQAEALLSGENGAAAVVGTTTLLYARTAINLGTRLAAELAQPGVTFGGGLQNAKAALVANPPYNTGSSNPAHEYTGLTLLGDPTLILTNGVGPVPTPINMPEPTPTNTPEPTPTNTPEPTATNTPLPTATNTPLPTATNTPLPTATNTPLPTATNTPLPTATNTPLPTATNTPLPTATSTPSPTPDFRSEPTATPAPVACQDGSAGENFSGGYGSASGLWTSGWSEGSSDDGSSTSGAVQFSSGELVLNGALNSPLRTLDRGIDLAAASGSVTMSFTVRRHDVGYNAFEADRLRVLVSYDGGATFSEALYSNSNLGTISTISTGGTSVSAMLTGTPTANTVIRIEYMASEANVEILYVDNLSISFTCSTPSPAPAPVACQEGTVLREWWTGISGTNLSNLTGNANYPANPSGSEYMTSFEAPTNWADNYGTRMRSYVVAPVSGNYIFYLASDDNGALYISTDNNPANKSQIASISSWTNARDWTKYSSQKSASIYLTAGQSVYMEALQKESGGGDNLAVGWTTPGSSRIDVIPGTALCGIQSGAASTSNDLPWIEDFNLPNDTKSDNGATAWTLFNPGTTGYTEVQNGRFSIERSGASKEIVWRSEEIDIAGSDAVQLSLDLAAPGSGFESAGQYVDYVKVLYSINGGELQLVRAFYGDFADTQVVVNDLRGSTLQVVIEAVSSGAGEIYTVDNVTVR